MKIKTTILTTSAPNALLHPATMSPAERSAGRFLRAPDGHDATAGGGDVADAADAPAQGAADAKPDAGATAPDKAADAAPGGDTGKDAAAPDDADGSIAGGAGADADDKGADAAGDKPALELLGAPEGDYEVKAPEGMAFDQAAFDAVKDDFRELNLSNDAAQRMVDLYADKVLPLLTERAKEANVAQTAEDMAALKKEWADAARADPVVGGAKFQETVDRIGRVWDRLGVAKGEGARKILDDSGLGNHPDLIKLLAFAGSTLEEASFDMPQGGGADTRPIWDRIYGQPEAAQS